MLLEQKTLSKEKLQVKAVQNFDELQLYADSWNQLAFAAPQQLPMSSYAWVSSYLEHYLQADESWICLLAFDSSELVGVMPLVIKPYHLLGFKFKYIGTWNCGQTCSIDMLAKPGQEHTIIPALIQKATEYYPHQIGFVFERIPENSPTIEALENLPDFNLIKEFDSFGSFLPISDRFAEYRASLSGNFRSNLNKAAKKLNKLTDNKMYFLNGNQATDKHLTDLIEVEAKSWKKEAGTAIINSPKDIAFFQSLTRRLSTAGLLEWQILEAEGKIIAINFAVRLQRLILIWKLAYDASYSKCSPGSMVMEEAIKLACESEHIEEINLMTDHSWYDNWKMQKRRYYNLKLYAQKPIPHVLGYWSDSMRQKLRPYKQRIKNAMRF